MSSRKDKQFNHLRQQMRLEEQRELEMARRLVNMPLPNEQKQEEQKEQKQVPPYFKTPQNQGGRPTKYESKYCTMLIEHMAKGYSFESFGAIVEVCRATLYNWLDTHDEFKKAKDRAFTKSLYFWETRAIEFMTNPKEHKGFHFGLYRFIMQSRFPEIYGDRTIPKPKEPKPETPAPPVRESEIILSSGFKIPL